MTDVVLIKTPTGLVPADDDSSETVKHWKQGELVRAKVSRVRNPKFHRKFFAMLDLGFDAWEPPAGLSYKQQVATKNRERFRKDVLVMAGFYTTTINLKGEVRLEAESMSFGKMDEDRFNEVYSKVADVILQKVLTSYTRADLDRVVEQMMGFLT